MLEAMAKGTGSAVRFSNTAKRDLEYGWTDRHQKSLSSLRRTYGRYHGRELRLLEIRFEDDTTDYGTFLVHRDARVKVRTESGEELWLDLFGSVLEARGRYKLFSYVTD